MRTSVNGTFWTSHPLRRMSACPHHPPSFTALNHPRMQQALALCRREITRAGDIYACKPPDTKEHCQAEVENSFAVGILSIVGDGDGLNHVLLLTLILADAPGAAALALAVADMQAALKLTTTCNHGGEGKWWPELTPYLKDRRVFILCDNDEQGEKHQEIVGAALAPPAKSALFGSPSWRRRVMFLTLSSRDGKRGLMMMASSKPYVSASKQRQRGRQLRHLASLSSMTGPSRCRCRKGYPRSHLSTWNCCQRRSRLGFAISASGCSARPIM